MDTLEKIRALLAEQLDIDPAKITMDSDIMGDFEADSLDIVDMVMTLEEEFRNEVPDDAIENLRKQGQPVTLISSGSSLKICLVAEGTADVYPRFAPTMEWDTAAGHAIARAAGCEVYHIDGKTPLKYNKEDLHNPWFIVKPL